MIVCILYDQYNEEVKRVSCDYEKLNGMALELNGDDDMGPYIVLSFPLEDFVEKGLCNDCRKPLSGLCPKCRYTLVDLKR